MYTLLLDSSESLLLVALAKGGEVIDEICYEAWQRQSELMIREIDAILNRNNADRNDIEGVVCAKGPGSYTGVRISMTIAKTISFALKVPLYLASSLEVLADNEKPSICLSNARSKRSYMGVYEKGKALMEDCIMENSDVLDYIASHKDYVVCGNTSYLGIEGKKGGIARILASCADERHREEEPLGARPVYLKDSYDAGHFKTVVRKMLPSDLDAVSQIENATFSNPYTLEQLSYELNENPVGWMYVAVVDHEVVGFIDFMITFNSSTIVQIAVKEEFKRKGIGNMLLGQMVKDCESKEDVVEFITLEVRASNAPAIAFYKKHRFQQITVKKQYYDDGEDAIYMVRSL